MAVAKPEDKRQVWLNVAQHFIDCIPDGVMCRTPLRHSLGQRRDPVLAVSVISARTVDFRWKFDFT